MASGEDGDARGDGVTPVLTSPLLLRISARSRTESIEWQGLGGGDGLKRMAEKTYGTLVLPPCPCRWVVALTVFVGLMLCAGPTTKVHAASGTPVSTNPAGCTVEPRPLSDFQALIATPDTGSPRPRWTAIPVPPVNDGTPADAATTEAVTEVVETLVACTNTGDFPRLTALFTDDHFRVFFQGIDKRSIASIATPAPPPPGVQATLEAVDDVRVLDDGRITAVVQVNGGRNLFVLQDSAGTLLVDTSIPIESEATPTQ